MASTYPTTQDTFTTKVQGGVISEDHINDLQNAVIAVEANVGTTNSADTTTIDYKLKNASSVNPGHKHTISAINDIEVTSPTDGQGLVYESASGKWKNQTTAVADATTAVKGINLMSVAPVSAASPIAVGDNDPRVPTQNENDALAGTSGTAVSSSNKLVDNADTRLAKTSAEQMYFGDGSDGNVTIGSNTTLTRDMFYNDLTISASFSLNTANFRVFVAGTLTNNNATNGIVNNGVAGGNASAGVAGTAGTAVAAGSLVGGTNGAAGATTGGASSGGAGSGAGTIFLAARTIAVQGGIQAVGGNAGTSFSAGGGVNGAGNAGTNAASTFITAGAGGDGGAGGGVGGSGGSRTTTKQSSKNLTALFSMFDIALGTAIRAGTGGGSGGVGSSIAGGSGGGQGGLIICIYKTLTTSGTLTVTGGTAAAGVGGGTAGTNGSSGLAISLQIS